MFPETAVFGCNFFDTTFFLEIRNCESVRINVWLNRQQEHEKELINFVKNKTRKKGVKKIKLGNFVREIEEFIENILKD